MGAGWAFPFAMAFVSPMSLLLLMGYSGVLDKLGPRAALTYSTLFCASVISLAAVGIGVSEEIGLKIASIAASKFISGPLFVFREAYVQLLTSQYWSFMASILTPSQSAKWFGPIAGLTSIASASAGVVVLPIVKRVGLAGAMFATAAMLFVSLIFSTLAYNTSDKYGFTPTDLKKKKPLTSTSKKSSRTKKNEPDLHEASMFVKATKLFARVPLLWALFLEILASQGLATILNVIFVSRLETAIPDDSERAGFVGMFFSLINVITMVFQIAILPPIMAIVEPRYLWRALPLISLLFTSFQTSQKDPSLYIISASLLIMKVTEYSARRMLDEMVYVPLDFESRFLGKEVIGVFGYRFGKSLMSLAISGIAQLAGNANFGLQQKSYLGTVVAFGWMQAAWRLSNYVPTRAEAEEAYKKEKGKQK
jgi:ATP/ADP translocase